MERGGESIVRKTPDTALYSLYVSTLWVQLYLENVLMRIENLTLVLTVLYLMGKLKTLLSTISCMYAY